MPESKCSSYEESVKKYTDYINKHIELVQFAGMRYFKEILDTVIIPRNYGPKSQITTLSNEVMENLRVHDKSKFNMIEFDPYRVKFYPCPTDNTMSKDDIEDNFQKAFKRHYMSNPHHPEFWVNDPEKRISVGFGPIIRMSNAAMVEMLADWIAMSLYQGSSIAGWWKSANGGYKEKSKLMLPEDIKLVSKFIDTFDADISKLAMEPVS